MISIIKAPTGNGFPTSGNAGTLTFDVPTRRGSLHAIHIEGNAGTGKKMTDMLNEIRINVNTKTQRRYTAAELNVIINGLNGAQYFAPGGNTAAADWSLANWFAEPWRKSNRVQEALAWGLADVDSFQVELDIKADTFASPVVPTLRIELDETAAGRAKRFGDTPILKWFKTSVPTPNANDWNDYTGLPKKEFLQQLHVYEPNLTEFEFIVDNKTIRQDTLKGNYARLLVRDMVPRPTAAAGVVGQPDVIVRTGYVDLVFDHNDLLLAGSVPMAGIGESKLRLKIGTPTAGTTPLNYAILGNWE